MDGFLRGLGACAVAFFLVLGVVAMLPPGVPHTVVGGAVMLLGAVAARRIARRPR
ncbi:hypothetical protein OHS33_13480 [Streptomyces sp. NBC_00536]|uniref:hypothetical protein n=1 Tax=Streptomyces sp. NBC_00536 TaxID=2975769 RepID=UPI002E7FF6F5|nr:hypothetical protein [Streptomyces sp. NBC_00536]WUC79260.1 hypothetical protein OHS33_13480 [Streptomyces sp. NBC_00536]